MILIDADEFKKHYCKENCGERQCIDAMDKCIFIDCLDDFPTAFDVDKVVEEIEKIRMVCYLTIGNTGNECYDTAYIEICKVIEQIEKIVKRGGKNV